MTTYQKADSLVQQAKSFLVAPFSVDCDENNDEDYNVQTVQWRAQMLADAQGNRIEQLTRLLRNFISVTQELQQKLSVQSRTRTLNLGLAMKNDPGNEKQHKWGETTLYPCKSGITQNSTWEIYGSKTACTNCGHVAKIRDKNENDSFKVNESSDPLFVPLKCSIDSDAAQVNPLPSDEVKSSRKRSSQQLSEQQRAAPLSSQFPISYTGHRDDHFIKRTCTEPKNMPAIRIRKAKRKKSSSCDSVGFCPVLDDNPVKMARLKDLTVSEGGSTDDTADSNRFLTFAQQLRLRENEIFNSSSNISVNEESDSNVLMEKEKFTIASDKTSTEDSIRRKIGRYSRQLGNLLQKLPSEQAAFVLAVSENFDNLRYVEVVELLHSDNLFKVLLRIITANIHNQDGTPTAISPTLSSENHSQSYESQKNIAVAALRILRLLASTPGVETRYEATGIIMEVVRVIQRQSQLTKIFDFASAATNLSSALPAAAEIAIEAVWTLGNILQVRRMKQTGPRIYGSGTDVSLEHMTIESQPIINGTLLAISSLGQSLIKAVRMLEATISTIYSTSSSSSSKAKNPASLSFLNVFQHSLRDRRKPLKDKIDKMQMVLRQLTRTAVFLLDLAAKNYIQFETFASLSDFASGVLISRFAPHCKALDKKQYIARSDLACHDCLAILRQIVVHCQNDSIDAHKFNLITASQNGSTQCIPEELNQAPNHFIMAITATLLPLTDLPISTGPSHGTASALGVSDEVAELQLVALKALNCALTIAPALTTCFEAYLEKMTTRKIAYPVSWLFFCSHIANAKHPVTHRRRTSLSLAAIEAFDSFLKSNSSAFIQCLSPSFSQSTMHQLFPLTDIARILTHCPQLLHECADEIKNLSNTGSSREQERTAAATLKLIITCLQNLLRNGSSGAISACRDILFRRPVEALSLVVRSIGGVNGVLREGVSIEYTFMVLKFVHFVCQTSWKGRSDTGVIRESNSKKESTFSSEHSALVILEQNNIVALLESLTEQSSTDIRVRQIAGLLLDNSFSQVY